MWGMNKMFKIYSIILFITAPQFAHADQAIVDGKRVDSKTVEEYIQKLTSIPSVFERRDPFVKSGPPFTAPRREDEESPIASTELERHAVLEYKIIAVMLGDLYNRALILSPEKRTFIIREKDRLGNRRGIIKSISINSIQVVEKIKRQDGTRTTQEIALAVPQSRR